MRFAILCALAWPLAAQQHLSIGAIGGVNLTPDIRDSSQTYTSGAQTQTFTWEAPPPRPIIGMKLEWEFTRRWSLELDALRREVRSTNKTVLSPPYQVPNGGPTISQFGPFTRTLTPWEFPALLKYRLPVSKWNPFVVAGPSFRPAGSGTGLSHIGVTAGAGIQLRAGSFRIEPQIRYTHWSDRNGGNPFGAARVDQVEFLVGLDRWSSSTAPVKVFGQPVRIGLITGIGLGTDFRVGQYNRDQRPERNSGIYGVVLEAPVTANWSIEVDGLYRPLHGTAPEVNRRVRFAHLTWEFPVLAEYRLGETHRIRPFLEGGPSFRAEGNLNLQRASHYGATFGGGIETSFHGLRIAPTYRFTRWSGGDDTNLSSQTHRNQSQLLVSFTF